jgi:predicted DsbA family dithiol-disulfide isomerase
MPPPLPIEVYADIACPWCYVGERRLAAALRQRPGLVVDLRWRPFQLQPDLPPGGLPWRAFAEGKFGGWEQARAMFGQVRVAGAGDGIAFDLEGIAAAVNTADAHRLVLFARGEGVEWRMAEALFQAYFEQNVNVGDREALLTVAEGVGLDRSAAAEWLGSDRGLTELAEAQGEAARLGVRGVPFVVLDGRLAVSGAQSSEVLVRALDRVSEDRQG